MAATAPAPERKKRKKRWGRPNGLNSAEAFEEEYPNKRVGPEVFSSVLPLASLAFRRVYLLHVSRGKRVDASTPATGGKE